MKNKRALVLLFAAHMISSFAQGITMLAIPWYFTSVVNQSELFGKVLALATVLSVFWSLYAGTLIDRYPRKNIFWFTALAGLLCMSSIAAYGSQADEMPIALVALAFVITFFGTTFIIPISMRLHKNWPPVAIMAV
jgi:DHA3 family macrolide efflux protein-like MFS transporter